MSQAAIPSDQTALPETMYVAHLLERVRLFQSLTQSDLMTVARAARTYEVDQDRFFFHEGILADHVYLLRHGCVKLTQSTPQGTEVVLHFVGPGAVFGAAAVLSEQPHPVSAQAMCWCQAFAWSGGIMARLLEGYPRIALNAMTEVVDQTVELQNRCQELATDCVERRLARALWHLGEQAGRKTQDGLLIDLPLVRHDLASMTGTTPYTVSRTLSGWERSGLIAAGRQWIVIRETDGLRAITDKPERAHTRSVVSASREP